MSLLVETALKVSLLLLLALAGVALLQKQAAALRHRVLASAVACAAVIPVLTIALPSWSLPLPPVVGLAFTPSRGGVAQPFEPTNEARVVGEDPVLVVRPIDESAVGERGPGRHSTDSRLLLFGVWIGGVAVGLGMLATGLGRLRWLASRSQRLVSGHWLEIGDDVARMYGLRQPVLLLLSSHPTLLVTWGLLRPKLLLPAGADAWTVDRIRIVLAHELAHVHRRDWGVQILAHVLRSLYWFNPLVWIASAQLARESEHACDDTLLNHGIEGATYAQLLLDLARTYRRDRSLWSGAPAIIRPSGLERRVGAMLSTGINRSPVSRAASTAALALLLLVTIPIAGLQGFAQSYFGVSGAVYDPQGRFLSGVALTLSNDLSESRYQVRSKEAGQFEFVGLPAGEYVLEADLPGFRRFRDRFSVAREDVQRDITLQVGALTETIVVAGNRYGNGEPSQVSVGEASEAHLQRILDECHASRTTNASAGGRIRPPRKLKHVAPQYPDSLRHSGVGGIVKLETLIGTEGRVGDVKLVGPEIHPELTAAAVEAVNQWLFDATLLNCVPVEVSMNVTIEFRPSPPPPVPMQ